MENRLPFNKYIRYLGKCISVTTKRGQQLHFKPMSIVTNKQGQELLVGPNYEYETVKLPTDHIISVWVTK